MKEWKNGVAHLNVMIDNISPDMPEYFTVQLSTILGEKEKLCWQDWTARVAEALIFH